MDAGSIMRNELQDSQDSQGQILKSDDKNMMQRNTVMKRMNTQEVL